MRGPPPSWISSPTRVHRPLHQEIHPPPVDPPTWTYDSNTDTYYRLATEFELEEHDWPEGTTVFTTPTVVDGLINGTNSTLNLGIPIAHYDATGGPYLSLQTIALKRRRTMNDATFVTSRQEVAATTVESFRPDFHLFLPQWVNLRNLDMGVPAGVDIFAAVFGDSHGGVSIQGLTAEQTFSVLGPSDSIWLESSPPSVGSAPGILVSKPRYHDTDFADVLAHWLELADEGCGGECTWETSEGLPPANCGDQLDNDLDCDADTNDWSCIHKPDYGCNNFGVHNHRWENSKDLAILPDIQWCTQMDLDGMPWYADVYSKGSLAAQMLNAIRLAAQVDGLSPPTGLPTINYRFGYCVFADSLESAADCVDDTQDCPKDYKVGGFGDTLDSADSSGRIAYFAALWDELDVAMHKAENDGITPKPVAMVTGVFSGDIVDTDENLLDAQVAPVGLASTVGAIKVNELAHVVGASTVEPTWFTYARVAHEAGHCLGLSHTDVVVGGVYDGFKGFMFKNTSGGLFAILGPSLNPNNDYLYPSQWTAWWALFPDKTIPRPNAFDHTGCSQNNQCPDPEHCWNAGPLGICKPESL